MLTVIGHTGFVGGYLCSVRKPDRMYNSRNIEKMSEESHDTIVCTGVSAVKWKANLEPVADMAGIDKLWRVLRKTKAKKFILISTVDVYPVPQDTDENLLPLLLANHAYGTHRLGLEEMVKSHFSDCHVMRLPALFGPGLKKNVLFDMLNNNMTHKINPISSFQWYGLDRLWNDIDTLSSSSVGTVNMAVEPVSTMDIKNRFFPLTDIGIPETSAAVFYDVHTVNASLFGGHGHYIESAAECMNRMKEWINREKLHASGMKEINV